MAERRLAVAGDADNAERFAGMKLQADILQPLLAAVVNGDAGGFEDDSTGR